MKGCESLLFGLSSFGLSFVAMGQNVWFTRVHVVASSTAGNFYIRQVNGVKLANILFSLLCVCVSVRTQSDHSQLSIACVD